MTEAQLQSFINSFDADNFDPADYSIDGRTLGGVNTLLSTIQQNQARIDELNANRPYAKNIRTLEERIADSKEILSILNGDPSQIPATGKTSSVGKAYNAWKSSEAKAASILEQYGGVPDKRTQNSACAQYTKATNQAKSYRKSFDRALTSVKKNVQSDIKAATKKISTYNRFADKETVNTVNDLKAKNDDYIADIAKRVGVGQTQISDNLERDLGYIVEKIDAIDRLKAEQYDEYAGEGSKDGVDKQLIANKDKYIADNYASINERLGMLSNDLGLYGAKLPAEFTTLDDIKQYYNEAAARSRDSKEDLGDILAGYVNEKITPEQQAFITDAMARGVSSDDPDYISQLVSNIGAPTIAPPPPTAESAEVLRAYNQRPEDRETEPLKDMTLYNQYMDNYDQQVSNYLKQLESYTIYGGPRPKEPVFTPMPDEALEAFRGPESARETFVNQFDIDDYLRKTGLWSKGAEDYAKTFGETELNSLIGKVALLNDYDINKVNQEIASYKPVSAEEAAKVADQLFRSVGAPNADFFPVAGQQIRDIIQTRGVEAGTNAFNAQNFGQQFNQGPGGLSLLQARRLATEIGLSRPNTQIRDSRTGEIVEDPINFLTNAIYEQGWDTVFSQITANDEEGKQYAGNLPFIYRDTFVPREQAEEFAKEMVIANVIASRKLEDDQKESAVIVDEGQTVYEPNLNYKSARDKALEIIEKENLVPAENFITKIINQGVDKAIEDRKAYLEEAYPEVAARWSMPTEYVNTFKESLPQYQEAFLNDQQDQFYNNIQTILDGDAARPEYNYYGSAEDITKKIQSVTGETKLDERGWEDYFNTWGSDVALATYDERYGDVFGRGEEFVSSGVANLPAPYAPQSTELDLSGYPTTGTPTTAYPTTGTPTTSFPTTGFPTTGYPTMGVPTGGGLPTTTYAPAPYTPPALLAAPPERPTLTPTQQLIGAPDVGRPVGAPMQALTAQQAGSQFAMPTQEDYFAYFGYTPEQLNAAQFLAEMEGAPRAGIAAQTVPVLPPAVTGAPAPTGMKEGGMPQDAQRLAAQGRGEDTMLIHMSPQEIAGLQGLAQQMGTSLSINPHTGLPEADIFNKIGKALKKYAPEIATVAMYAAGVPLPVAAFASGTAHAIGSGSLEQGIARGISSYGIGSLAAGGMQMAGVGPSAGGSAAAGTAGAEMGSISLTPSPGDLDYITSVDRTLASDAANYAMTVPSTVPSTAGEFIEQGVLPTSIGLTAEAGIIQARELKQQERAAEAAQAAYLENERKKGRNLFESTLGRVPLQYARSGGLMQLAGGGMTYAEGGGTTGATNEPRMVKGTGDGMSDSVPATIEGVQEARLANDEFVIPADVVADLGNGSSSAGAQQLYDMMDRVRLARHGTTEQPPEIDVRKLMPA